MKSLFAAALCLGLALPAAGQTFLTVEVNLASLRTVDLATGAVVTEVPITLTGFSVRGASGLARQPETGTLFAAIAIQPSMGARRLATLDPLTGVATDIGPTGRFAGLAFDSDGTLYGVTGDGGNPPESLFTIDTADGTTTLCRTFGAGTQGETIGFNPVDGRLYHGSGTCLGVWESFDPSAGCGSPLTSHSLAGMHCTMGSLTHLFANTFVMAALGGPDLFTLTTAGNATRISFTAPKAKGIVPTQDCYSDRVTFLADCGPPDVTEDFSLFTQDTSFESPASVPLEVGTLTATAGGLRNLIDTPPLQLTDNNGTSHASCYTNADTPVVEIEIRLCAWATCFGADVSMGLDDEQAEMVVYSGSKALAVCPLAGNGTDQFVGFRLSGGFDRIVFRSRTSVAGSIGEGFGLDNLVLSWFAPIGTPPTNPVCTPNPNSTGFPATITATGSLVASDRNVTLTTSNIPRGKFGYFIASRTPGFLPTPGNSQGNLCILGSQARYTASGQIGVGPAICLEVGGQNVPTNPHPGEAIAAGDTWYWQCWHRDEPAPSGNNFTDSVCVTFQ